jgi:hypothetical protein
MWLNEAFGWLGVLLSFAGAAVSALSLGRSRWAWWLLGGFLTEATVSAFYRVVGIAMRSAAIEASSVGAAFLLASLVGLAGRAAIVRGVAGVLSDVGGLAPAVPQDKASA